jgi:signal transduction histidine kinase
VATVSRLPVGPNRSRVGGSRLTARLAVELFVLAAMITGACAWTAIALVDVTFQRVSRDELKGLLDTAEKAIEIRRTGVEDSFEHLWEYMSSEPSLLERFLLEDAGVREEGRRLMHLYQLDFLDIHNDEGKILTSGHQPERIGLTSEGILEMPDDRAELSWLRVAGNERFVLVERRDLRIGPRALILVGGAWLDEEFVDQIAADEAALLVESGAGDEMDATASTRGTDIDRGELADFLRGARNGPARLKGTDSPRWLVDFRELDDGGKDSGWLVVGVDLARMDELGRQLVEAFVLLGASVGLIAALAGVWIARRTARPVRDLVRAFDAIATGEADYSSSIRAQDEMQELVKSFSRLHRALEDQRRRSVATERVAAWREVARHVAHEVKNPLAPIRLTVENLLRARMQAPEKFDEMFREGMQTILDEVQQLSRMVSEFAEFVRLPLPAHRPVVLEELIDRAVDLYASEPGVTIRKEIDPALPPIELDADQVSRALKNVIGNAIEAARAAEGRTGGEPLVRIRAGAAEGLAEIEIADSGPGFSEEAERRLFEPYFTTKDQGTGLGMALTYRIIIEHGGVIFAENRSEGGARVVIRLPLRAVPNTAERAREVH